MKVNKYNDFILDNEFNSIIENILIIVESEGKWLDDNTYVWDLKSSEEEKKSPTFEWDLTNTNSTKTKLEKFLSKMPRYKIRKYFFKLLDKIKHKPSKVKKSILMSLSVVFLSLMPFEELVKPSIDEPVSKNLDVEFIIKSNNEILFEVYKKNKKSEFNMSQNLVKIAEKGYSSDRKDKGNYIKTKFGKKFVGTNHGISAPVLAEYLGRIPTQNDMKNLTYKEALEIYKKQYWTPQNLTLFNNQSIANLIYDGCVNQGIQAMKDIVRAAYIENGMKLGSLENPFQEKWIKMANDIEHESLFNSIKKGREKRYRNSDTFSDHGEGWLNRLNSIDYEDIKIDFEKLGI